MSGHFDMVKASVMHGLCFHPAVESENEFATKLVLTVVLQDSQSTEFVVRGAFRLESPDCSNRLEGWDEPQQEMY
jgi:hypothetical protein